MKIKMRFLFLIIPFSFAVTSCKKGIKEDEMPPLSTANHAAAVGRAVTNSELIAYKRSNHQIMAGFYRTYGSPSGGGGDLSGMFRLPDSLDIVIVFGFSMATAQQQMYLRDAIIPALHAKGTKVLVTGDLDIPAGVTHNTAGYQATAQGIMNNIVNKYGFDGYDIDVEFNPSGTVLTDMAGVYSALSAYLGPRSGTGKLLTFDTNQPGSNNMFRSIYNLVDYVWYQSYARGSNPAFLQSIFDGFSSYIPANRFIPGFSFYEEYGDAAHNYWDDIIYPLNGTGSAYDLTRWEPDNGRKGGVFSYALDRDAPLSQRFDNRNIAANYRVTNDLIKIMNPDRSSATGVTLYQDINYGGSVTRDIPKGSYTLAQLQSYGFINDWASSLVVPAGWRVTMYSGDNFSGTSWSVTSNNANFLNLSPNANDQVTSVSIQ